MSVPSTEHNLLLENIKTGEATFKAFAERLKELGFVVSDEHAIDPTTGQIAYMSVTSDHGVNWMSAQEVFNQLNAMNIRIGIGSMLRRDLWNGINNGSIKLHDFGFRGRK